MPDLATTINDTITAIGQCMADEVIATGGGALDRVCLLVPGEIAQDQCECGQFAQTITNLYPSTSFPAASTGTLDSRCGPPWLVAAVTAQVARCVPGMDDQGIAPSCDALAAAAFTWVKDAVAMRKGAGCCLVTMRDAIPQVVMNFSLGPMTPVGPSGLCMAAEFTYLVAFNSCICPS